MDNLYLGDQNKTDRMKKLDFHKLDMVSSLQRQSLPQLMKIFSN